MNLDNIEAVFSRKQQALTDLHVAVAPLGPSQLAFRPRDGSWSVNEIVEHVSLVEAGVLRLLRILIQKAEATPGNTARPENLGISLPDGFEDSRNGRIRTAASYEPGGRVPVEDALATLRSLETEFVGLRPRLAKLNLQAVSFRHDALGTLTLGQWTAFLGVHEKRHLGQILRIMDAPDYPKGAARR